MWFVRHEPWRRTVSGRIPWRTHKPRRDASASGTTDFVTWEFIPLYHPPRMLADNITLTNRRNRLMWLVRHEPWRSEDTNHGEVRTRTMVDTQTTAKYKCHRHDRFCNMGIYSLVPTSPDAGRQHNTYGQTKLN